MKYYNLYRHLPSLLLAVLLILCSVFTENYAVASMRVYAPGADSQNRQPASADLLAKAD